MSAIPKRTTSSRNVTDKEREQIVAAVLAKSTNGVPRKGAFVEIAAGFPFTLTTVSRVWRRALESAKSTGSYLSISYVQGRSGRPKIDLSKELERLRSVPVTQHSTIRSAAAACRLPPTTLFRRVQDGHLNPATSVSKPLLTDHNKTQRLSFSSVT